MSNTELNGSDYLDFLGRLQAGFEEHVAQQPLFTTEAAVQRLRGMVEKAHVNGVFLSSTPVWGTPVTGDWRHLAVSVPPARLFRPGLLSASQPMAELREHHRALNVALDAFKSELLEQALGVLQADALTRSEKFLGGVEWLLARQRERRLPHGRNLLRKAVASAPAGFCTPRSSMPGVPARRPARRARHRRGVLPQPQAGASQGRAARQRAPVHAQRRHLLGRGASRHE